MRPQPILLGTLLVPLSYPLYAQGDKAQRPNVILIMTDDQGYGDLHCHGNDIIVTPNLDQMHDESVRFTNYHTDPTSAPTRSALMTGRYSRRVGVIHTIFGKDNLRVGEETMADMFSSNGYRTAMYGKWHLGTNYPLRPMDRGFDEAIYIGGGSINQMNDYWDNDRMNDHYCHNGEWEQYEGFSTDVFFDEAMKFIKDGGDEPFFVYIPTSEAHAPFNTMEEWDQYYLDRGLDKIQSQFFATITQVDKNMGRLREFLKENNLDDNTIVIYTTDNGTTLPTYYNAGMRSQKGNVYEGGHRVPLFMTIPQQVRDVEPASVSALTTHMDIMPTLADLCGLDHQFKNELDGRSFISLIDDKDARWDDRTIFIDQQRIQYPIKWRNFAMMTQRWRLVNRTELYDMDVDPGQKNNVAEQYPEVVDSLNRAYEARWEEFKILDDKSDFTRPIVGTPHQKVIELYAIDLFLEGLGQYIVGQDNIRTGLNTNGSWFINVAKSGNYRFELRRWPKEADVEIRGTVPEVKSEDNDIQLARWGEKSEGVALDIQRARLSVNGYDVTADVTDSDKAITFDLPLEEGNATVRAWFYDGNSKDYCAYYVYVYPVE